MLRERALVLSGVLRIVLERRGDETRPQRENLCKRGTSSFMSKTKKVRASSNPR